MLRFEMETLPSVDCVPLLEKLAQPFDQMDLLWYSENFTQGEVDFLNTDVFKDPKEQLVHKAAVTPNADPTKQKDDIVLAKGMRPPIHL